ncbi:MAG: glycoside hydrolase family 130 protein [Candidatus Omnitrophota bacterium]
MIKDAGIVIAPDNGRVIIRPYIPADQSRISGIVARVMALGESAVEKELKKVMQNFSGRHHDFEAVLERQFEVVRAYMPPGFVPSKARKFLIGGYFIGERSYESTALFNPSIVAHPDQSGVSRGSLRIIISLRATGEGHISALAFRSGVVDRYGSISLDTASRFACTAEPKPNTLYDKTCFTGKLYEMGLENNCSKQITEPLPVEFTMDELQNEVNTYIAGHSPLTPPDRLTCEKVLWLARCNYEAAFDPGSALSERVLFPFSPSEQNGMEDARFVFFKGDDGIEKYYATYTAYDGRVILPQIMETEDFVHFKMITLNGPAAVNKGMALFPRKVNGRYAMISRNDNERLFLMYSDNIHFWHEAVPIIDPLYSWEFVQIGNCGSPIETERGWLLLTHGVGPLRQYSIGAALLDRDDPSHVLGRLAEPLICWEDKSRSGYVPNVVYSCGAMVHGDMLIIPYALSDQQTAIALVSLRKILDKLS